jgi:hypothetical protein
LFRWLGFKVDPGSERRFIDSIGAATVKAVALGTAITATAGAGRGRRGAHRRKPRAALFCQQADKRQRLRTCRRPGSPQSRWASTPRPRSGAVESLARFLRNSPGGEGLLKNLGIGTRDVKCGPFN